MKKIVRRLLPVFFISFVLISCHVVLIGAYDEVTDQGFQKIQNRIARLLVGVQNNLADSVENKFAKYKSQYEDIEGQIESIKVRCNALPKYHQVVIHAEGLDATFKNLEGYHKAGISLADTASLKIIKRTFDIEFRAIIQLQNALKREKNTPSENK